MVQLLFLPAKTLSTHKTRYQLELEDQEARAHAATFGHQRAGTRGQNGNKPHRCARGAEATASGSKARSMRSVFRISDDSLALQKRQQRLRSCTSEGLAWIKTGPLDPFLRLPTDLSIKDRNMVFYYLDTAPGLVHGVKRDSVCCPVRTCSIPNMTLSPLYLQWLILMGEIMTRASKAEIYARRAAIYVGMRKALSNPADFLLDNTLLHLSAATVVETRLGNVELAETHFRGLLQLLALRKGLRTFQDLGLHIGVGMLYTFVIGQVPLFRTREELLEALGRMRMPRACKPVPKLLRGYFEPFCSDGAHLGNLHMLNMILAEEPEGYMKRLVYNITGSGEGLKPVAMTFMIGQSAVEVGEWYGQDKVVRSWETIEFVQLLAYATISRQATLMALSSWLTGEDCGDVDLDDLKTEILDEWDLACSMGGLMRASNSDSVVVWTWAQPHLQDDN